MNFFHPHSCLLTNAQVGLISGEQIFLVGLVKDTVQCLSSKYVFYTNYFKDQTNANVDSYLYSRMVENIYIQRSTFSLQAEK